MASIKYEFSIANDTKNGAVNSDRLKLDIIAASSITTPFDYIGTLGDALDVWFLDALTAKVWEGHWLVGTTYHVDDAVVNDGHAYVCTSEHSGQEPPNISYWTLMTGQIEVLSGVVAAHTGEAIPTGPDEVQLYADDIAVPTASDGKLYMTPDMFSEGTRLQWIGAGDHATNGRGMGTKILLWCDARTGTDGATSIPATREFSATGVGTDAEVDDLLTIVGGSDAGAYRIAIVNSANKVTVDRDWPAGSLTSQTYKAPKNVTRSLSFNDWVELAGGLCHFKNAEFGSYLEMSVSAAATAVTPNGGNTGNCNVVNYAIIPAAGNGAYDVDLDDCVPIPTQSKPTDPGTGYYEWNWPNEGKGAVTAGVAGASTYNLYTVPISFAKHANRMWILGTSETSLVVSAVKPAAVLPFWTINTLLHNSGSDGVQLCGVLYLARMKTS